jgi:RNA polymerase sigma-70 factor (ECF subfamily)
MTNAEDPILVRRALAGEPESFGLLCRRYYPSLVAVADAVLLDRHLAEDAAQETLAEACRQLSKLKAPERFGPWVGAICRNVARDMLRERQRQKTAPDAYAKEARARSGDGRQMEALDEALNRLPRNLREVVFLRFYNELSYRQMAQVLGVTPGSIDGRLRRAKKRIAAYLTKRGFGRC